MIKKITFPAAAFIALLLSAVSGSAQSILQSAENFVLLGGTTVSVAGAGPNVFSNGDVGAGGAITGFPPAVVVGGSVNTDAAVVNQALLDLTTARNGLSALATSQILSGMDLSGMTLTPGVYAFADAAEITLNGTRILTLDAQFKNNVVWVFNISTTLITAEGAQVVFINLGTNGGSDNGLFWNAGTSITFGESNTVAGNYLAGTSISFGTTIPSLGSGGGRALAEAGVSFAGEATLDAAGGPGGGNFTGGLDFNNGVIAIAGYVLLSTDGAYAPGDSGLTLVPGVIYPGTDIVIDGSSSDAAATPATLTIFKTTATLTGINTYTGDTIIDTGILITGTGNLPTNGNVTFVDSYGTGEVGQLVFDQPADGSYGGLISGNGSVTKEGAGVLTITTANTYSGGTIVNAGTLLFAGNGTLGATTGLLTVNAATLDLGGTSQTAGVVELNGGTITNGTLSGSSVTSTGGAISAILEGAGSFVNTSGTTTFTGLNTYTGGTVINGGTLVANVSVLPGAQTIAIDAPGTLVLDDTGTTLLDSTVTGTGTISKQGDGLLILLNSTTAAIDLQEGELRLVNNVGAVTVGNGAILSGEATINGNLINNGTVSAGFSPGTIVVAGNYTQASNATLVVEFASAVDIDRMIVTGTASLDGTLQLETLGGYNPVGETFTILTATGGVTGTFASITGPNTPAAILRTVNYGTNDVSVDFAQIPFATFAETPNQAAAGGGAQLTPAITDILNTLPLASDFPAALNAISPQGYEVWSDIAFAHTQSLADRLARQPAAMPGRDNLYFEGGQTRGQTSGDADVQSTRFTSDSGLVGGNYAVSEQLTIGAFFEYTDTESGLGSAGSNTNVKDKMPGVRAAWKQGFWFATASAAYGFDDYESTRQINFTGTSATAKSDTKGTQWLIDITAGRHFQSGMVSISPFVGMLASGWKTDSFTETGAGVFNTRVDDQSAQSLRSQVGVDVGILFNVATVALRPHVRAAWIHEFENESRAINASYAGGGNFAVMTRDPEEDSARLSAGFNAAITPRVSLYADYSIQTGDTVEILGEWRGGVSIGF